MGPPQFCLRAMNESIFNCCGFYPPLLARNHTKTTSAVGDQTTWMRVVPNRKPLVVRASKVEWQESRFWISKAAAGHIKMEIDIIISHEDGSRIIPLLTVINSRNFNMSPSTRFLYLSLFPKYICMGDLQISSLADPARSCLRASW
jgi:hypothetical protein